MAKSSWLLQVNGKAYAISAKGLQVGRGSGNQVNLADEQVSRRHALVWLSEGLPRIRDLGSRNDTFVNDEKIDHAQALHDGDSIRIGNTLLSVQIGAAPPAARGNLAIVVLALLIGLIIVGGGAWYFFANTAPPPQASLATVYVGPPPGGTPQLGSGSIIDPRGFILTSSDIVGGAGCAKELAPNTVPIGLIPAVERPPEQFYLARIYCTDPGAGLALLQIGATGGGGPLPPGLQFSTIPIGNSDSLQVGDQLTVIGYPGSGAPVRVTQGIVSAFLPGALGLRTRIATDAGFGTGQYGGTVLNASGQLVALPVSGPAPSLAPINLAKGLLAQIP